MNAELNIFEKRKPKIVNYATILFLSSIVLGGINYFIVTKMSSKLDYFVFDIRFFSTLISQLIQLFLIFFINQGKRLARNIYSVLLVLGLLLINSSVIASFKFDLIVGMISLVSTLLDIIAIIMIFSKSSNRWFNG